MLVIMRALFNYYQGTVMVRLPLEPIKLILGFTHGELDDTDYRNGSVAFLYIWTLLTFRISIRKLMGIKRPRTREPITIVFPTRYYMSQDEEGNWW
mmetsp:Transcript_22733/g.21927  ORF Transcript_22733/g.21927 Transcript_22733/m.21927 type:complete len:96 (+) Transcript_22733:335-622(+)